MSEWSPETRRVLRAYLRAVASGEPLQRELARRYGLSLADLHALRALRELGEVPISRLGAELGIRPSNATNLVDRLEGAGLVERGADPADRRVTVLRLTPGARTALSDRQVLASSGLPERVERLAPAERIELATLLERVLEPSWEDAATDAEPEQAPSGESAPEGAGSSQPGSGRAEAAHGETVGAGR